MDEVSEFPEKSRGLHAQFFETAGGRKVVLEWLKEELDKEERIIVGSNMRTVEDEWPAVIKTKLIDNLKNGIWEIRSTGPKGELRVYFSIVDGDTMLVLHGLRKKTRKADPDDIQLARKRLEEFDKRQRQAKERKKR